LFLSFHRIYLDRGQTGLSILTLHEDRHVCLDIGPYERESDHEHALRFARK
jgi:hypothetical protein